jgi:hypothetical protein
VVPITEAFLTDSKEKQSLAIAVATTLAPAGGGSLAVAALLKGATGELQTTEAGDPVTYAKTLAGSLSAVFSGAGDNQAFAREGKISAAKFNGEASVASNTANETAQKELNDFAAALQEDGYEEIVLGAQQP